MRETVTMPAAIEEAKKHGNWCEAYSETTSVNVGFLTHDGKADKTQFALHAEDKESELISLWDAICEELNSANDGITYVEALGYVE